jgi:hypothetical protein
MRKNEKMDPSCADQISGYGSGGGGRGGVMMKSIKRNVQDQSRGNLAVKRPVTQSVRLRNTAVGL